MSTKNMKNGQSIGDQPIDQRQQPQAASDIKRKTSAASPWAPYETLFDSFELIAQPVYNFWEADEATNESNDKGDRSLADVPRYIRLSWKKAPVVRDPKKKEFGTLSRSPVPFAVSKERIFGQFARGALFTSDAVTNFSLAKGMVANGHVAPGVICATVELGTQGRSIYRDPLSFIDEDAFLELGEFEGMSFHELLTNFRDSTRTRSALFTEPPASSSDGFFFVERSSIDNAVVIRGAAPRSPMLTFLVRTALPQVTHVDPIQPLMQLANEPDTAQPSDGPQTSRVNFVDPTVTEVFSEKKVSSMQTPEQLETMAGLAPLIPALIRTSNNVPGPQSERLPGAQPQALEKPSVAFLPPKVRVEPTVPSVPGPVLEESIAYIGYVIEKYAMSDAGSFVKVDEIDIDGSAYDEFIDTHVAYGKIYRYRMRSIIRWSRSDGKTASAGSSINVGKSSYFAGHWSARWAYASVLDNVPPPWPDELTVRPESDRLRVCVTMKFPFDGQRDISGMALFRKTQDEHGNDVSDWERLGPVFGTKNVLVYDDAVRFFDESGERYVYAAVSISKHGEVSALSEQYSTSLNKGWKDSGEDPIVFVSQGGSMIGRSGAFSVVPHRRMPSEIIDEGAFSIGGRTAFGNRFPIARQYVLRMQSLDTGEVRDYPFSTRPVQLPNDTRVSTEAVAVQDTPPKDDSTRYADRVTERNSNTLQGPLR